MGKNLEEMVKPLMNLINKGLIGATVQNNSEHKRKLKYNTITPEFLDVFTKEEITYKFNSMEVQYALAHNLNPAEQCEKIINEKIKLLKDDKELILIDKVCFLNCQESNIECNFDIVNEYVNKNGYIFYERVHTY